jgi:hypothetical protein
MGEPLVVVIPHNLGKAEATARLKSGLNGIRNVFSGKLTVIEEAWSHDELRFRVALLGQAASGTILVAEQSVCLSVDLPWLLAKLAAKAKALVERQGRLMLDRKWRAARSEAARRGWWHRVRP